MKILALSASYRNDGPTEQAAKAILAGAASKGAETLFTALRNKNIHFCRNCRACNQVPGSDPGDCPLEDDVKSLIRECLASDVLILSSPLNFFQATALAKQFLERLVPLGYWPWGTAAPKMRVKGKKRKGVLITSSAAPAVMAGLAWAHSGDTLKYMADALGAKVVKRLHYGLASVDQRAILSPPRIKKAFDLGVKLSS